MNLTVSIDENQSIQVTDEVVETESPDRIAFAAEGVITVTGELLERLEGRSLKPVGVGMAVGESELVEIDVQDGASLRLETVDVGIETPDSNDISPGMDTLRSSSDDGSGSTDTLPGAVAFTVEGELTNVPEETFGRLTGVSPSLASLTFAVDDSVRSDGGSDADVLVEVSLVGFRIVVRRDGTIDVGTRGSATGGGLP